MNNNNNNTHGGNPYYVTPNVIKDGCNFPPPTIIIDGKYITDYIFNNLVDKSTNSKSKKIMRT
jgi:hypothetical protein